MREILTILFFIVCSHAKGQQEMFFSLNTNSEDSIPFITQWVIPTNSYTLTLNSGAGLGSHYAVDWGDGTTSNHTTSGTSHLYATAGTYNISIKGVYKAVNFTSKSELRTIIQWGDVYCTSFTCASSGLDSITTVSSETFFSRCTSLNGAFYATAIKHIPVGLLNSAAAVISMNQIFQLTASIDTIPAHLFDKCIALKTIQQGFRQSKISGSIPNNLFDYNVNLTDVSTLFLLANQLSGVMPTDFFKYNTKLTTVSATFDGLPSVTGGISADFFANCTLLTNFSSAFEGCIGLTFVSSTAFANTPAASNFTKTFYNCSSITSAVPELWVSYPSSTHTTCFTGCTNASNYASIPTGWK